jgi:hypothetical protein
LVDPVAEVVEVGVLGLKIVERGVDTIVVGLAREVQLSPVGLETPERRLRDADRGGDQRRVRRWSL